MNRKSIFEGIIKLLLDYKIEYELSVSGDHLIISKETNTHKFRETIRCQNFGDIYLLSPNGVSIKDKVLENEFESILIPELKSYYSSEFTLFQSPIKFEKYIQLSDYRITKLDEVNNFVKSYYEYHSEVEKTFYHKMVNLKNIAQLISSYPYEQNLKVVVGSKFPVHLYKKIFLLSKGKNLEMLNQYKVQLKKQIDSFPVRKPNRKDEAKYFEANYLKLIEKLDSEKTRYKK